MSSSTSVSTTKAALYLRSSKDRHDVSIESQRRELKKLADDKGLTITAEFADVVESGKDEFRPGFQKLLRELKAKDREWTRLLLVDTSRLSRRRYVAQVFKHECKKRGVLILYAKVPEVDPISQIILESVFEAMDEVHSLMSRDKGLAGMAENVRSGFRAGGRAPKGYELEHYETGATRDGKPVRKSKLRPCDEAAVVARFLKLRAQGAARSRAKAESGAPWSSTTLIGVEWNALTYAGHTVWNVHNEFSRAYGYKGGRKRKPRSEWVIHENTHPPLITQDEADAILHQLETSTRSQVRRTPAKYLLSGMLKTPEGDAWWGNQGKHYRTKPEVGKGAYVPREALEQAVVEQVIEDMLAPEFIRALTQGARQQLEQLTEDPASDLRPAMRELSQRIDRYMELAEQMDDPAPALRKAGDLESKRQVVEDQIRALEKQHTDAVALAQVTEHQVRALLVSIAKDLQESDREVMKDTLSSIVDQVILDPESKECRVYYRIDPADRNRVASPRGFEPLLPP